MSIEDFYIEGSEYIPTVDFNAVTGILNIKAESYHHYTQEFFEPIFDWLKRYLSEEGRKIELNLRIKYLNTNSSKIVLEIMNLLTLYELDKNGQITINWLHEGDDDEDNELFTTILE